jgi:uncharacterized protein (UPF0276 family)
VLPGVERLGLGVGMDLPWSAPYGIQGGHVAERTHRFLRGHAHRFAYLFVSWQPPHRGSPSLLDLEGPWAELLDDLPIATRALHHTALNLASQRPYARGPLLDMTNALIERFGFAWVNEDLGFWSVGGRPLAYPQPPSLDRFGIETCVRNICEVQRALAAPLVVEFPGFDPVAGTHDGHLDAYDAFREIVERSGAPCNLDTGHLLTWRSLIGHQGEDLLDGLERLPLEHCVEIHCAGAAELHGRFVDTHHGVVHDLQLRLLDGLLARCPNLRVVTYEDPRFSETGELPAPAETQLRALETRIARWMNTAFAPTTPRPSPPEVCTSTAQEDQLFDRISTADDPFARQSRGHLLDRAHRGIGTVRELYAAAVRRWQDQPHQPNVDALVKDFLRSGSGSSWTELPWAVPGTSLEDAFGQYLRGCAWMPSAEAEALHLAAVARVLVMVPDVFPVPVAFHRVSGGWAAVAADATLFAAIGDRYVTGPLPASMVALVTGGDPGLPAPQRAQALKALSGMGLAPVT